MIRGASGRDEDEDDARREKRTQSDTKHNVGKSHKFKVDETRKKTQKNEDGNSNKVARIASTPNTSAHSCVHNGIWRVTSSVDGIAVRQGAFTDDVTFLCGVYCRRPNALLRSFCSCPRRWYPAFGVIFFQRKEEISHTTKQRHMLDSFDEEIDDDDDDNKSIIAHDLI